MRGLSIYILRGFINAQPKFISGENLDITITNYTYHSVLQSNYN